MCPFSLLCLIKIINEKILLGGNIKREKIIKMLTMLVLTIVCVGLFVGCEDKPKSPYYVNLDVYKPNGELVETEKYSSYTSRLSLKYDGNPKVFDIKVYSEGQKRYINDDDIESGTLNSKINVSIKKEENSQHFSIDFKDEITWPTEIGYCEIYIGFNDSIIGYDNLDPNYRIAFLNIYLTIKEE